MLYAATHSTALHFFLHFLHPQIITTRSKDAPSCAEETPCRALAFSSNTPSEGTAPSSSSELAPGDHEVCAPYGMDSVRTELTISKTSFVKTDQVRGNGYVYGCC